MTDDERKREEIEKGLISRYGELRRLERDTPMTAAEAYKKAQEAANARVDLNRALQANTPAWYQTYLDRTRRQRDSP